MRSVAIILAGGQGKRMNSSIPKQYIPVLEQPLIAHTIRAFERSLVDEIILIVGAAETAWVSEMIVEKYGFQKITHIVEGGMERYDSVFNGLQTLRQNTTKEEFSDTVVLVHDGARACISPDTINHVLYTAYSQGIGCIAAVPVKDTIKTSANGRVVDGTLKREALWIVQTPQAFMAQPLYEANEKMYALKAGDPHQFMNLSITDDACIMESFSSEPVTIVMGDYKNIKVTTPEDLLLAEAFLK